MAFLSVTYILQLYFVVQTEFFKTLTEGNVINSVLQTDLKAFQSNLASVQACRTMTR